MSAEEREKTTHSSCAFDLSGFHPDPSCRCYIIPAAGHSHGFIYCETCKIAVDVEAFGTRIAIGSAGWSTPATSPRKKEKEG